MSQPNRYVDSPLLNVSLFSLCWALQVFVTKLAFNDGALIVPLTIQSTVLTIIVLVAYVLPRKWTQLRNLPRKLLWGILIANAVHFGLGGFLSTAGIALTSAFNAGFL